MFIATGQLSRQLMCIDKCHWQVYSSFSMCNSAIHRHTADNQLAPRQNQVLPGDGSQGKIDV